MLNDLRYAVRQLLKNPEFTAAAVLMLALALGSNLAAKEPVAASDRVQGWRGALSSCSKRFAEPGGQNK